MPEESEPKEPAEETASPAPESTEPTEKSSADNDNGATKPGTAESDSTARQIFGLVVMLAVLGVAYYAVNLVANSDGRDDSDGADGGENAAAPAEPSVPGVIDESKVRTQMNAALKDSGGSVERVLFSGGDEKILVLIQPAEGSASEEVILSRDEFGRYVDAENTYKVYP